MVGRRFRKPPPGRKRHRKLAPPRRPKSSRKPTIDTPIWQAGAVTELPRTAAETTVERPWPVRLLSENIARYVARMSPLWVEGQVVQFNRRPGASVAFLTLRDAEVDMSLSVTLRANVLGRIDAELAPGAHVVVHAKPTFWTGRGTLQLDAADVRAVGLGELLARIEALRRVLAGEGLFDDARKKPLPFLPHRVGLVVAREGQAEHDVVVNARARWPQVEFEIRRVAVQGVHAVREVTAALAELDRIPEIDVIVIARGGGSVEDLLPFSNETLIRAVAAAQTPVVSAIGHEPDSPLLDLVADVRASTPTDAARRIVPDVSHERRAVLEARNRLNRALSNRLAAEQHRLDALRSRPVLTDPLAAIDEREEIVLSARDRGRRAALALVDRGALEVSHLLAQVTALSPKATLDRGYSVVVRDDGHVVRAPADVAAGAVLTVRTGGGSFAVETLGEG